jgi:hypothetical protein
MTSAPERPAEHPLWTRVVAIIGIVAHVAVGYLYLAAGLVAPLYGIVVFWLLWVALLALAIRLLRRHPLWTLAVPFVAAGVLLGGITLGEALLGWTA